MELLFPIFHLAEGFNLGEVSSVYPLWPWQTRAKTVIFQNGKIWNVWQAGVRNFLLDDLDFNQLHYYAAGHKFNIKSSWRLDESASAEWRRLSRELTPDSGGTGCTCLLTVSKYTRLLFPSSALIQETRFSPHSSLRLTWTSCPSFLSEPGGAGSFLLIHVLKTALIKNKMFVWFRLTAWFGGVWIFLLHFKSEVWLEVCLTLFPFLKMYFSYISALTSNSLPETFPSLISSCSLAFFFCSSFKTLFFIFHQSSASPPFSFSLFILTSLSEQRWKKSLVMAKTAQAVWRRPGLTLLSHNLCLLVLLIKVAF